MRRTIARYLIVALIQTLRMTSVQVFIQAFRIIIQRSGTHPEISDPEPQDEQCSGTQPDPQDDQCSDTHPDPQDYQRSDTHFNS